MRKSTILFKSLGIIFLAMTAFLIWEIASVIISTPESTNSRYVPSDARWTVRVDGNAFFKESFSQAFLTSEESEIVNLIQELVENRTSSEEATDFGIDFLSDIYLSSIERDGQRLLTFTFNLRNSAKFSNLLDVSEKGKIAISSDKKVGILLIPSSKNIRIDPEKLAQYALQLVKKPTSQKSAGKGENVLSSFWIDTDEYRGELHISAQKNDVIFSGQLDIDVRKEAKYRQLKPNGFHFSHSALTGNLKDTISYVLESFLPSLPSGISSLSINYRGTDITTDRNMMFLPEIDVLLGYEDSVSIAKFLAEHLKNETVSDVTSETFECVGKKYYYQQVDYKTIYIGREKPTYTSSNHFMLITGNPSTVMTLRGDDSYLRFARLMPTFLATENFIHSMEKIDLSISTPKNGKAEVSGKINFASKSTPIGAILEFLVRTEVVK